MNTEQTRAAAIYQLADLFVGEGKDPARAELAESLAQELIEGGASVDEARRRFSERARALTAPRARPLTEVLEERRAILERARDAGPGAR